MDKISVLELSVGSQPGGWTRSRKADNKLLGSKESLVLVHCWTHRASGRDHVLFISISPVSMVPNVKQVLHYLLNE